MGSVFISSFEEEAEFELEKTSNDVRQSKKADKRSHSQIEEKDSIEMVADSINVDEYLNDAGDREDVGECNSDSNAKIQATTDPIKDSKAIGLELRAKPIREEVGQMHLTTKEMDITAWANEERSSNMQSGNKMRLVSAVEKGATCRQKGSTKGTSTMENSRLFLARLGSDEGREKEGRGKKEKREKKRTRKRTKLCNSGKKVLEFVPCATNPVAGGSVGDSGVAVENGENFIKRLKEMESRDKKATEEENSRKTAKAQKGEREQLAKEEIKARRDAFLDLWKNLKHKERMMQQKSRKTWLLNGDANTMFFHNCVKGRWKRSEMNSIYVQGTQIVEVSKMKEEISSYFESMFKEKQGERPKLDGICFKQIYVEDNSSLIKPFNVEEIKAAVEDCDSLKAPGPDGFNFRFVKSEWRCGRRLVRKNVLGAMLQKRNVSIQVPGDSHWGKLQKTCFLETIVGPLLMKIIHLEGAVEKKRLPRGDSRGSRQKAWKASLRQSLRGFCASDGRSKGSHWGHFNRKQSGQARQ
ncbi:hypothetical protein SLEP1_g34362 [Rubroshorea leprosula]|uniref:Reverse transcriptase n=1 Tax=Rubroshorea leprosula TaxID=152421 RepID=A0AAV5KJK8_9ROSI|nr:hypothetical protein SLEP1_g34362 [Rubroshorea leprosula]